MALIGRLAGSAQGLRASAAGTHQRAVEAAPSSAPTSFKKFRRVRRVITAERPFGSAGGGVRTPPASLERQAPGIGSDELVDRVGSPGSRVIKANGGVSLQQGGRNLPEPLNSLG